jgi:hypothetical protein
LSIYEICIAIIAPWYVALWTSNASIIEAPYGGGERVSVRLQFNPKVRLESHGSTITSDAGLLAFRELKVGLSWEMSDKLNRQVPRVPAQFSRSSVSERRVDVPVPQACRFHYVHIRVKDFEAIFRHMNRRHILVCMMIIFQSDYGIQDHSAGRLRERIPNRLPFIYLMRDQVDERRVSVSGWVALESSLSGQIDCQIGSIARNSPPGRTSLLATSLFRVQLSGTWRTLPGGRILGVCETTCYRSMIPCTNQQACMPWYGIFAGGPRITLRWSFYTV